jgi:hypothetical protein
VIRRSIPHVEHQLELVRSRRGDIDELEGELVAKLERMQLRLAELERAAPQPG